MAFEYLFNKKHTERKLFHEIILFLQGHFEDYQNMYFFLGLEKEGEKSCICYAKEFKELEQLKVYDHQSEYESARVLIRYRCSFYQILFTGFRYTNSVEVYLKSVILDREILRESDITKIKRLPWELIVKGLGEIQTEFISTVKS